VGGSCVVGNDVVSIVVGGLRGGIRVWRMGRGKGVGGGVWSNRVVVVEVRRGGWKMGGCGGVGGGGVWGGGGGERG